jgi:hypothetical protein
MRTEGQRDVTKLIFFLGNFANAPKNYPNVTISVQDKNDPNVSDHVEVRKSQCNNIR